MRPERRSVPGLADEIADLAASLKTDHSPRNVMRVAEALWLLERPEAALEVLRPLVHQAPALVAPRILLAWCAEDAGLDEEARIVLDEAAALDPANPYARRAPVPAVEAEPRAETLPEAGPDGGTSVAAPEVVPPFVDEPDEELEAEPERALDLAQLREVPPGPLYSATLAEIFARQGFQEKAIEIYRRLATQDPGRQDLANRIRALERQVGGSQP